MKNPHETPRQGSSDRHAAMIGRVARTSLMMGALAAAAAAYTSAMSLAQQSAPPPPAVVVEKIEVQQVKDPARFTARIEAIEAVNLRARVTGFLRSQAFKDGQAVKAGDTLF